MHEIVNYLHTLPLDLFARAGGGGSSSGGDGGDGILFILGYAPMHFVGSGLRRASLKIPALKAIINLVGWVIAIVYAIIWVFIWDGFGIFVGLVALLGMAAGLYNLFAKLKQSKQVKDSLNKAVSEDSVWDEPKLVDYATQIFNKYQYSWANLNYSTMQSYLTPYYYKHFELLVNILQNLGRRNELSNIKIIDAVITDVNNSNNDNEDSFTIGFTASATDRLIDTINNNKVLFTDNSSFTEYWTFNRSGDSWLLASITQSTANLASTSGSLYNLAIQNNYHYSLDMGWLFIPSRGQLFNGGKFGVSDINNHIVGLYKDQLLVQLYSYNKNPKSDSKYYVIAQVNVPKTYGNIVVRRKKALQFGVSGLNKVETEWTKFNNKYEVFASNAEQATSFELLNPTYMERLEALDFEVNIEVVDNIIYLYTDDNSRLIDSTYQIMLDLINKAFTELRL